MRCKSASVRAIQIVILCGTFALSHAGFAQGKPVDNQSQNARNHQVSSDPGLTLGAGDLLEIVVYNVPELTLKTRVTEQDTVLLPLVGEVSVAGKTVKQFQDELAQKLVAGDLVLNPQISVLVTEFATQGVSVIGEVNQPGIYPLIGPHRLFDGIAAAGGLSSKAARVVKVIRKRAPDDPIVINLPQDMSSETSNVSDIELLPGDTVVVAKAGVVFVVGEVNKAGGFLMENNTRMTVLQAVSLAQGPTKFASLKKATIVRRNSNGVEEIPIQLDKIMAAEETDHLLLADDILLVPTSNMKLARKRMGDAAVAAVAAGAIWLARQ